MRILFLLARFYPVWAIALGIVVTQLGVFFRRRASVVQYYCWAILSFFIATTLLWIAFRGDLNSDEWVRVFLEDF